MDLTQEIYDRAAKITAIKARETNDDRWAFKVDDADTVKGWLLEGVLKAAVASGIIKYNSGEAPEPDVLPDEQLTSVVFYLIYRYYASIGELKEATYWKFEHEDELKRYRFDPNTKSTARLKYRMA
jgi:hypothetical protein